MVMMRHVYKHVCWSILQTLTDKHAWTRATSFCTRSAWVPEHTDNLCEIPEIFLFLIFLGHKTCSQQSQTCFVNQMNLGSILRSRTRNQPGVVKQAQRPQISKKKIAQPECVPDKMAAAQKLNFEVRTVMLRFQISDQGLWFWCNEIAWFWNQLTRVSGISSPTWYYWTLNGAGVWKGASVLPVTWATYWL